MKRLDIELGYLFTVDEFNVVDLDYNMLLGTHDYFSSISMNQEFKNPYVQQRRLICRKEIERRLFGYDMFIKRPENK